MASSSKPIKKPKRPPQTDTATLVDVLKDRFTGLIICLSNSWGGLEQVAADDAIQLGRLGLRIHVLCLQGSPIHEKLAHREEVIVTPITFRPKNLLDFKLRTELNRFIDDENVNLVHCHQPSLLGSVAPWLWNRREVCLFVSRHIMNDHDKRSLYHRAMFRRIDSYLVMSQALRENVLQTHALKERQVKVVHLGLDFDVFDPEKVDPGKQRGEWGADEATTVVGLVGRIDPAKGQGAFIKAAAGVTKSLREGEKLKFVIVGEETLGSKSEYLNELREMVAQFRLGENVVFTGYHENIPEVMSSFDIFVMPSKQETFGLVAIEAMSMECPIVISRGGSSNEIVGKEEFGLLIRPEDAFDLQRKLRHLLDNPMERIQMGRKGREHVVSTYDRQVRIQRTLQLYERNLRRRGL